MNMRLEKYTKITTQAACVDDKENIWLFSNTYNALYKFDYRTNKIEFVTSFYREKLLLESMYTKAIYYDHKIFFIPCCARNIAIYNIEDNRVEYIYVEEDYINYNAAQISEDRILMFPVKLRKTAWIINLKGKSLCKVNLEFDHKEKIFEGREEICFVGDSYKDGKSIYAIYGTDSFLVYDVSTNDCNIEKDENCEASTSSLILNNEIFFLSLDGCFLYKMGENQKIAFPYNFKRNIFSNGDLKAYSQILQGNGKIFCIPCVGNDYLWYEQGKYVPQTLSINWKALKLKNDDYQPFASVIFLRDRIILLPYQCGMWAQIKDGTFCSYNLNVDNILFGKIMKLYKDNTEYNNELAFVIEGDIDLNLFIRYC